MDPRLVIVVTGANSGVGFGVCHRLLHQLSYPNPPDARPYFVSSHASPQHSGPLSDQAGITIVMACRNPHRAETARTRLYSLLDQHISALQQGSQEHGYATAFRSTVKLELETLDLASMKSVMDFGKSITQKYEYISHLILNAGTATYSHLDTPIQLRDMLCRPIFASTHPRSNVQKAGVLSEDNLGYVWQCNFFGQYSVYRSLQPLLAAYSRVSGGSARVIWMSSLVAAPLFDPIDDWQLTKTLHSYEASKFQIDLVASELERLTLEASATSSSQPAFVSANGAVHHLISSPGVVATNMMDLLGTTSAGQKAGAAFFFWVARMLGCRHIHLSAYSSAVATVHLALAPLKTIPTSRSVPTILPADEKYPPWHAYYDMRTDQVQTLQMGSEADRWGNEYPGIVAVPVWGEHKDFGKRLLEKCERLYQTFGTVSAAASEDGPARETGAPAS
ncbi:hypothetical protein V8D89_006772 [Ganoderma adspersum]